MQLLPPDAPARKQPAWKEKELSLQKEFSSRTVAGSSEASDTLPMPPTLPGPSASTIALHAAIELPKLEPAEPPSVQLSTARDALLEARRKVINLLLPQPNHLQC